jgi:hypothetical protein
MSSSPQPVKAKIASIRPVQVEVVPHTPQTSGDLEANNGNGELPQAVEVRSPQRITLRPTISALIGYAIPVAPGRRVQPTNAAPNANFHLSEREKVLMEGYRIARLIRYPLAALLFHFPQIIHRSRNGFRFIIRYTCPSIPMCPALPSVRLHWRKEMEPLSPLHLRCIHRSRGYRGNC